jgi:thioredoxin 1
MATEVTEKTFDEVLKKNSLVLIDFWAGWCMPCKMLAPTIEEISKEYKDKVFVGKVDIDKNHDLASKFGIMSIPTVLLFKNGQAADMIVGAVPKSEIRNVLEKHLEK